MSRADEFAVAPSFDAAVEAPIPNFSTGPRFAIPFVEELTVASAPAYADPAPTPLGRPWDVWRTWRGVVKLIPTSQGQAVAMVFERIRLPADDRKSGDDAVTTTRMNTAPPRATNNRGNRNRSSGAFSQGGLAKGARRARKPRGRPAAL